VLTSSAASLATSFETSLETSLETSSAASLELSFDASIDASGELSIDPSVDASIEASAPLSVDPSLDGPPSHGVPCRGAAGCRGCGHVTGACTGTTSFASAVACRAFMSNANVKPLHGVAGNDSAVPVNVS
jgi:hypothetical protein